MLRTDFGDEAAWNALCAAIQVPNGDGFRAYVDCVNDPAYSGLTVEQFIALATTSDDRTFAFLADRVTLTHRERLVLVVDLYDEPGRRFRVIPGAMWSVENNLSIANTNFDEFAESVDPDGIFRGFAEA